MIAFEGGARLDDRQSNGGDIWVVNADDSNPRNLTHSPDVYDAGPAWSPDSTAIVLSSDSKNAEKLKAQIAMISLANGQIIYLADQEDNRAPAWIP